MDHHRQHAKGCLVSNGFRTEEIPESDEQRADLLAHDDTAVYVVEVKGKEMSEEFREMISRSHGGEIATLERTSKYRNRLDGIIRKAESQLVSTPAPPKGFRILWMSCLGGDEDFIRAEFERTFCGLVNLQTMDRQGQFRGIFPCFFYERNSCFARPAIDAAVFVGTRGGRLYLNEFGHRKDCFRLSRLYVLHAEHNAVMDPIPMESEGKALILRGDVDRSDQQAKWKYLLEAYGYMTAPAEPRHFSAMISVPLTD